MALHVCVRGIGIRRSKDLRAEIGKCPNSTNERKNMSTMTLRKRIALVAVTALGAGLLSVVAVPSANAAALAAEKLTVYPNGVGVINAAPDDSNGSSVGLVTQSDTAPAIGGASQLTQTATIGVGGLLAVAVDSATYSTISVTGGTITSATGSGTEVIAPNQVAAYTTDSGGSLAVLIRPTAAGTMVVNAFAGASAAVTTTNFARVTVTVVASTLGFGVVSTADSTVYYGTAASATSDTSTTDVTSSNSSKANTEVIEGTIDLYDSFGNAVTASTGLLTCSVTGGAVCNLDTSAGTIAAGASATDFSTHTASNIYFSVAQGTTGAPASGTLTISYNGTAIATKSFLITGTVAKINVTSVNIGRTGATSAANFGVSLVDAAGNAVYAGSGISVDPLTLNEAVTAVTVTTHPSNVSTAGVGEFQCSGTAGLGTTVNGATATPRLRILNAANTYVYSDRFTAQCGGDAKAFTASLDKASYTPGSVATLTLKFTDTRGNKPNDFFTITAGDATGDAANVVTFVGAPGTVVTAAAAADKPLNGEKTYQFIVGTTEGDFNMVVDAPYVRAQSLALGGTQGKITVAYKIAASSTATSNADVLKAIVSLIASINKQIAALQKALLRR
jgi:hypothetical protein